MSKQRRSTPDIRREELLDAAVELAREHGYQRITRDIVARRAGSSVGLVSLYLGTMDNLRRDVMRAAVRGGIVEIVAQGLAAGDPHARKASDELKQRAADHLLAQ